MNDWPSETHKYTHTHTPSWTYGGECGSKKRLKSRQLATLIYDDYIQIATWSLTMYRASSHKLFHPILVKTMWKGQNRYHYPHFADEKAESPVTSSVTGFVSHLSPNTENVLTLWYQEITPIHPMKKLQYIFVLPCLNFPRYNTDMTRF